MANIRIVVNNKSSSPRDFVIFNGPPENTTGVGPALSNVWGKAPGTGPLTGSTTFGFQEKYYAVCGMAPQSLTSGLQLSTLDYQSVTITADASRPGTNVHLDTFDGGVYFNPKETSNTITTVGSFGISTAEYDPEQFGRSPLSY